MKLGDAIIAGVKPLAENRLRAGLSILGIFIGIAGVLCMIAIGDGGKRIIAEDIEKLGGANQFTIFTLSSNFKRRRLVRPPTERYLMFCPIMKILKSWSPTEMGIKRGSF